MSQALQNLVPVLDGTNYMVWARAMQAYLMSQQLWLVTDGTWVRPTPADPAAITVAERQAFLEWNQASQQAKGTITLRLTPTLWDKVEDGNQAAAVWTKLKDEYSAISPIVVYELYVKTMQFRLKPQLPPRPQIEYLEGVYLKLAAQTIDIPGFIRAMSLLQALPLSWGVTAPIIQTALASGNITAITWLDAKNTILCYWEAEQAKKGGSHMATKISAVKRKSGEPSFRNQKKKASESTGSGAGSASGSGKKFHKRCGKRGGKAFPQAPGFGHVHFTNSASLPAPTEHSIMDYNPNGLIERVAHDTPITSSFGNGPYASFNKAMQQCEAAGLFKGSQTVKTLEEHILAPPSTPASGIREKGPFPSTSKCTSIASCCSAATTCAAFTSAATKGTLSTIAAIYAAIVQANFTAWEMQKDYCITWRSF